MEMVLSGVQVFEFVYVIFFYILFGVDLDSDDEEERDEEEWDEEEMKEYELFKRFLEKEKQKGQVVKKEESGQFIS